MKISPDTILGPKIKNLISIMRESVFIFLNPDIQDGNAREEITIITSADVEMLIS